MELVCRWRNNFFLRFGFSFLQLESPKTKDDRVSLQLLYPTIHLYKTFVSLKRS